MTNATEILAAFPPDRVYVAGAELRARLNRGRWPWQRYGRPAFDRAMAELEDAGLVVRRTVRRSIGPSTYLVRHYALVRQAYPEGHPVSDPDLRPWED